MRFVIKPLIGLLTKVVLLLATHQRSYREFLSQRKQKILNYLKDGRYGLLTYKIYGE